MRDVSIIMGLIGYLGAKRSKGDAAPTPWRTDVENAPWGGEVLFASADGTIYKGYREPDGTWYDPSLRYTLEDAPTYWMPIPALPKENE